MKVVSGMYTSTFAMPQSACGKGLMTVQAFGMGFATGPPARSTMGEAVASNGSKVLNRMVVFISYLRTLSVVLVGWRVEGLVVVVGRILVSI